MQHLVFGALEATYTDFHIDMPAPGLIPIATEQAIPPGKVKTEIAIGFFRDYRMMHPMHVGCHQKQAQDLVYPWRDIDIAMVKHGDHVEQDFGQQYSDGGRAKQNYHQHLDEH